MILDRLRLALPGAETRESLAHAFLWANRVLFQTLLEGSLFSWVGGTTAMDLPLQDCLDHWEVMSSPLQFMRSADRGMRAPVKSET